MNRLTNIFKLLADETRLRMIVLLFQQDLCVCELSCILEIPQPRVSKNLAKMRDLNLVEDERREQFVFYSLKNNNIILAKTIQNIIDNLSLYPQLLLDQKRLADKDKHLKHSCLKS